MSTTPRFPSAAPGEEASFATVLSHTPGILTSFFELERLPRLQISLAR